jgi:hypothetical protein
MLSILKGTTVFVMSSYKVIDMGMLCVEMVIVFLNEHFVVLHRIGSSTKLLTYDAARRKRHI